MPLSTGSRLGVYDVLDPLGAGGMGEVYRALDTRLGREVAIKGLPEEFSRDPGRLARFDREARLLAALNHPSIAAIYGLEEFDGTRFIVMELVPGETLSEALSHGGLSVEDSLRIARQMAEALEAAHERGIVHRDLKPANVKVTPEGRVKVLDLGLAKAFDAKETASGSDPSLSPTLVIEGTQPGVILGTAEFMSPEQARGKAVDKRTDIWAFGCVLFELLSGHRAFTGETASDILVGILRNEPPWEFLPESTPPRIRNLLARCLQKNPGDRLRDIGDARMEIEETLAEIQQGRVSRSAPILRTIAPLPKRRTGRLVAAAAAVAAAVVAGVWLARRPSPAPPLPSEKYMAVLPFEDLSGQPDGQLLGDAFAETMSARLAGIAGLRVVTPRALTGVSAKNPDLARVAQDTGATLVLRGALQRVSDRYRVTYSLLRAPDGVQVAGDAFTGTSSDMFAIQDRMADSVIAFLDVKKPEPPRRGTPGLAKGAQVTYLKAIGALQHYDVPSSVDTAITLLSGLNAQDPYSALVLAGLGRAYLNKFEITRDPAWAEKAIASCELARKLDDRLPEVHTTLGQVLAMTGKPAEAKAEFERALAEQPSSIEAVLGLANAEYGTGSAGAEATYRRALAQQPSYWAVHNQFGSYYYRLGRYAAAIPMFREAARLRPDSVRAFNNLGAALFRSDRFSEARAAYQSSIRIKPNDGAYTNLGNLEYYLGNYRAAAQAFEEATKLTPGKYLYWANLGDAYRWTPELKSLSAAAYEKAAQLAERELSINPKNAAAHSTLATCYAKLGRFEPAREHLEAAVGLEPGNPDRLFDAAIVANLAGNREEALDWIRRAVAAGVAAAQVQKEPEFANLRGLPGFVDATAPPKSRT